MNQKLVTLLFATVFYYGVTNSSPLEVQNTGIKYSEPLLPEEKPPTSLPPTPEHINEKIHQVNSTSTPTASRELPSLNITGGPSKTDEHSSKKAVVPSTIGGSNVTALNGTIPSKNQTVPSGKNSSEPLPGKPAGTSTVTPPTSSTPASPASKSTAVNPHTNAPNIDTPTNAKDTSQNITTTTTTTSTTTTRSIVPTAPVISTPKPDLKNITTEAPVSINKDNAEHNTPAPVQEKHFDGQSFIGGMALTIGLTAIAFIAFKYYKSGKIDINYRTL